MPREVTVTLYGFDELSDAAKAKAIKNYRDSNCDDWFATLSVTQLIYCELHEEGWLDKVPFGKEQDTCGIDVAWRLSCSQGDGVCFYNSRGGYMDSAAILRVAAQHLPDKLELITELVEKHAFRFQLFHHGRYTHHNSISYEWVFDFDPEACVQVPKDLLNAERVAIGMAAALFGAAQDTCRTLEKAAQAELDYRDSDEFIAEELRIRDDDFLVDGSTSRI